jgi:hypothetical protein
MRNLATLAFPLLALVGLEACASSGGMYVSADASIDVAPPDLPVYDQPPCPGDGYLWTPGYWAWNSSDYYWVPGTWVQPPEVGFLWTPGYWGRDGGYAWHEGYWGEHVGFYGGVSYGFGYTGQGYQGGRWDNGHFFYNQSVTNVNRTVVHNVYNTTIVNNNVTRVSYNGNGGIATRPTRDEEAADQARHVGPVAAQTEQDRVARGNPQLRASANQGKPPIAATPRAGTFDQPGVVGAREGGSLHGSPAQGANSVIHPKDLPPIEHPASSNTGDAARDQQNKQEQDKLAAQQNQERLQLQQKQDHEHQNLAQQHADAAKAQQLEQRHQQQTHQLAAKHQKQQQTLKARQQSPRK